MKIMILRFLKSKISLAIFAVTLIGGLIAVLADRLAPSKEQYLARAKKHYDAGRYDSARLDYMSALAADTSDPTAFAQLGLIWLDSGSPLQAASFLSRAKDLAPDNLRIRAKFASCLASIGQYAEARKEAKQVLEKSPIDVEALLTFVSASSNEGEIAEAEATLEKFTAKNGVKYHLARASLALRKGDAGSAGRFIAAAVEADPNSAEAHSAMGSLQVSQKENTKAEASFRKAAELASLRTPEQLRYAEFKFQQGDLAGAKEDLKKHTQMAPDSLTAWHMLAQIYFAEKHYDESLTALDQVFIRDARFLMSRILQSEVFLAKSDGEQALNTMESLAASYPNSPLVNYSLGRINFVQKNYNQASAALKLAIQANPNYTEAILLNARVNLLLGQGNDSLNALNDLLKKMPSNKEVENLLAETNRSLGQLDAAAAIYKARADANPGDYQSRYQLGLLLKQQQKIEEAREIFRDLEKNLPDRPEPVIELSDLDLLEKNYADALDRINWQISKTPNSGRAHYTLGRIYLEQKDTEKAQAALKKAVELEPSLMEAYDLLTQSYADTGKLTQAIEQLEKFLKDNPKNVPALLRLAISQTSLQQYPKSAEAYDKIIAIRPDFTQALNNSALLHADYLNNLDKAYDLARKARESSGNNPSVADTLGWILYKRNEFTQALPLLQEAASTLSNDPDVLFHLGMTQSRMSQKDEAKTTLNKALSGAKSPPWQEAAKKQLAMLEAKQLSIEELLASTKTNPNDPSLLSQLGEAYAAENKPREAVQALEQAYKFNPRLREPVIMLCELYAGPLNNPEKALELAQEARQSHPDDPKVANVLGRVAYRQGKYALAYSALLNAGRSNEDAEANHALAWSSYFLGHVTQAREFMQSVVSAKTAGKLASEAKTFVELTNPDPAARTSLASAAEKVLQVEPENLPALMVRAGSASKDRSSAKLIYENALAKYPEFAPAMKELAAVLLLEKASLQKAGELAARARLLMPNDPDLSVTLGIVNYLNQRFPEAVQLLEEGARAKPLNASASYYLGMAQLKEDEAKGQETLKQAIAAGLEEPLLSEAKKNIPK